MVMGGDYCRGLKGPLESGFIVMAQKVIMVVTACGTVRSHAAVARV